MYMISPTQFEEYQTSYHLEREVQYVLAKIGPSLKLNCWSKITATVIPPARMSGYRRNEILGKNNP